MVNLKNFPYGKRCSPTRAYGNDGERPEVEFIQLLADACQLLAAGDLPGCIKQLLPNRFPAMRSPLRAAS